MEEMNNEQEIRIAISSSMEENIRKVYEATKKGCIESLKTLMEEDPHMIQKVVTSSSNNNEIHPLLHLSISHGHVEVTRLLLHHDPELPFEVDSFQRTPLHLASKVGEMEIVKALLEKNMSACFVYDNNGLIPLHCAVTSGQMDIMKDLIKARPRSLWMKLRNGQTVLHLCHDEEFHLEVMKLLIETYVSHDEEFLNTPDHKGNTILDLSIMLRQCEMVVYLLTIPEVKTRSTRMTSIASSNNRKESQESQIKMTKTRNLKRKRQESISFYTKKTPGRLRKAWRNELKYKGDWFEEVQGTMMLVATVIATVTFQAGMYPPGRVWQENTQFDYRRFKKNGIEFGMQLYSNSLYQNKKITFAAGTAIMSYQQEELYWIYSWINSISFLASVSVILMIVGRFPLQNRICSWLLALAMCIAVVFLAVGYLLGLGMVNLLSVRDYFEITDTYKEFPLTIMCWLGVVGMVGLWQVAHFLKSFFHIWITCKLKSHSFKVNSARFFQSTT